MRLFYVNPEAHSIISFDAPLTKREDCYAEREAFDQELGSYYDRIGKSLPFPENLVEQMGDEQLDEFMVEIEYNQKKVKKSTFMAVPSSKASTYISIENGKRYRSIGVNAKGHLLFSEGAETSSAVGATDEELAAHFRRIDAAEKGIMPD